MNIEKFINKPLSTILLIWGILNYLMIYKHIHTFEYSYPLFIMVLVFVMFLCNWSVEEEKNEQSLIYLMRHDSVTCWLRCILLIVTLLIAYEYYNSFVTVLFVFFPLTKGLYLYYPQEKHFLDFSKNPKKVVAILFILGVLIAGIFGY